MFCIVVLGASTGTTAIGAVTGALVAALAIYLLAWTSGVSAYRLVLVGVGIAALLSAVTQYLLTRAEIFEAQRAVVWLTGSLNARGWEHVRTVALADIVLVPALACLAASLRMLLLGDDTAKGLGVRVERDRLLLVLVAVALAGTATAAAGPIVFVAFVAAPIARRLTGDPLALVPRRARRCRARRRVRSRRPPAVRAHRAAGGRRDGRRRRALPAVADRPLQPRRTRRMTVARELVGEDLLLGLRPPRGDIAPLGRHPARPDHGDRRTERVRQIDAAARARPIAATEAGHRAARRHVDPPSPDAPGGDDARASSRSPRSPRTASPSPIWWAAGAFRTSDGSAR